MSDSILRATTSKSASRLVLVDATQTANFISDQHKSKAFLKALFSEAMVSSLLLASRIKHKGAVQVSYHYSGDISNIYADSTPGGLIRAKIDKDEAKQISDFDLMLSEQFMSVIQFAPDGKKMSDSSIEMPAKGSAKCLSAYLLQSEQVRSAVGIQAGLNATGTALQYCAGYLVELFPEAGEEQSQLLEDNVLGVGDLGKFFKSGVFDLKGLLSRLAYPEEPVIHLDIPVQHHCPCSKERVTRNVSTLDAETIREMADEGGADVTCDYCLKQYWLSSLELKKLADKRG